jgi:hypothetical protein
VHIAASNPSANARRSSLLVFYGSVVGIPAGMNKLTRLRRAEQRIIKVQRRIWLAQALAWPTVIAAGATSAGVLVWFLRRHSAGNRHEMPDLPGAHEDGTVHVEPDGQLTHTSAASDAQDPLKAR